MNGILDREDNRRLQLVDSNGNPVCLQSVSLTWTPSGYETTSDLLPVSATCAIGTSCASKIDEEWILHEVMDAHDASQSEKLDDGGIYFSEDGTALSLSCGMPCGNKMGVYVSGASDPIDACDRMLEALERMKSRIDDLQKRVFELALKQKGENSANE